MNPEVVPELEGSVKVHSYIRTFSGILAFHTQYDILVIMSKDHFSYFKLSYVEIIGIHMYI